MDDERAVAAVTLLACYPFAVFFSAAYTEGLFLLAMIGRGVPPPPRPALAGVRAGACWPG